MPIVVLMLTYVIPRSGDLPFEAIEAVNVVLDVVGPTIVFVVLVIEALLFFMLEEEQGNPLPPPEKEGGGRAPKAPLVGVHQRCDLMGYVSLFLGALNVAPHAVQFNSCVAI